MMASLSFTGANSRYVEHNNRKQISLSVYTFFGTFEASQDCDGDSD